MHSAGTIRRTKSRMNISGVGPRFGSMKPAAAITRGALTLAVLSALLLMAARPTQAQTESVLHSFVADGTDGTNPYAGLIVDAKGNLYGTTVAGGPSNVGTVFKVTPSSVETVLYSFTGRADGAVPYFSAMLRDKAGNLYGTTLLGGAKGGGTVFKLAPDGTETVLHSFNADGIDGYNPYPGLAMDKAGNLYGTTYRGGASDLGTVFKVAPAGTEMVLYSFAGGTDGCFPYSGGVILGKKGVLYGTTFSCGANGLGTVFKLTPTGAETVLHSFAPDGTDGVTPLGSLAIDKTGNIFGTTNAGGAHGNGTVFKLTPTGTETVIHSFAADGIDGFNPQGGVVIDKVGNLYGTTYWGGVGNVGTAFMLTQSGTEMVLHSFGGADGANPRAGLVLGKKSILYGTTLNGGDFSLGTVFKIVP
jgi:uncharacterized repeat protein (TIGR03803 family)